MSNVFIKVYHSTLSLVIIVLINVQYSYYES